MIPTVSDDIKVTVFDISVTRAYFDGIDNAAIAAQVMESHERLYHDPNGSLFEDTMFNPERGSVGHNLLLILDKHFKEHGYSLAGHWSHIHRPLESTNTHDHCDFDLSFAYYVQVPEGSGDIVFEIQNLNTPLKPREGELIVFPGWLKHRVSKNLGSGIRISIAGNLKRNENN